MPEKRRFLPKSRSIDSYIVRIYRRAKHDPHSIVGVVEDVEVAEKKPFKSVEELWRILASSATRSKEATRLNRPARAKQGKQK